MVNNNPKHIAVIMDGNGRWAKSRGMLRIQGHEVGAQRVEDIIEIAPKYGVEYLTLYAFSKENWQRPAHEVTFLMGLLSGYLDRKLKKMMSNNVVFHAIGNIPDLPKKIQQKIKEWTEVTKNNTGLVVTFAFSYSSRFELTQACQRIAQEVKDGSLQPEQITEKTIQKHLYTANLPDPDLLVRTSGEMRISNFLLWQISYTEIYVTDKFWPEFTEEELVKAIEAFQKRERRFGKTSAVSSAS